MNGLLMTTKNGNLEWGESMSIVEHIYGIIDSKIDFMELKSRKLLENLKSHRIFGSHQTDNDPAKPSFASNSTAINNVEPLFSHVENVSRSMYLLEKIKMSLRPENVHEVIKLLNNDKYLTYDDEQLDNLLLLRTAA